MLPELSRPDSECPRSVTGGGHARIQVPVGVVDEAGDVLQGGEPVPSARLHAVHTHLVLTHTQQTCGRVSGRGTH